MKIATLARALPALFVAIALAACAPTAAPVFKPDTAAPAAASTTVPPATATPWATATAAPPSPTPTAAGSPVPLAALPTFASTLCPATPTPQATVAPRPLRFVYLKDGKVWLWKEETGKAAEIPVQGQPVGLSVSSDSKLVAYRVRLSDQESEIRVVGTDGQGERKLATTNTAEVPERYPGTEQYYVPSFNWVPGTHLVYYSYQRTCCGEGRNALEVTHFVDADSGAERFALAGGEVDAVRYAPGGRQMAALAAADLRLIDTGDGRVLYRFPVSARSVPGVNMAYSPDGRWLAVTTAGAFTVVDTASGIRRDIPFEYQPYGMGSWSLHPPIAWLANGPIFYTVFSTDSPERLLSEQTRCTVWRIDAEKGTVAPVYQYTGGVWLAQLSPDRMRLLYRRTRAPGVLDLYVADLATGREALYDSGDAINIGAWGWAADSLRFAYRYNQAGVVRLGSVCAAPTQLQAVSGGITFLDAERYLGTEQAADGQRYKVISLSGEEKTIVDLAGPAVQKGPPYDAGGPLYGYSFGD